MQCWPSRHPETGRTYQWLGIDDGPLGEPRRRVTFPPCPRAWLEALTKPAHNNGADLGDGSSRTNPTTCGGRSPKANPPAASPGGSASHPRLPRPQPPRPHPRQRPGPAALRQTRRHRSPTRTQSATESVRRRGRTRPARRPAQATEEFRDFVNSDRAAQLLAQPDHDDWVHNLGEPPPDDDHPGEYTPPKPLQHPRSAATNPSGPAMSTSPRSSPAPHPNRPSRCCCTAPTAAPCSTPANSTWCSATPNPGKTLLVLAGCVEALGGGRRVLYVDLDHNGARFILPLLAAFGASVDTLADPALFRYYDAIDSALSMLLLVDECALWRPAVAVIDTIGELLPMMGADSNDADDFTRAHTRILKPLAKTGAAVIEIDHLAKNLFSRSQGPTGAAAKRRPIGGLAIKVVCRRTFIPGKGGTAELLINKDRLGGVRRHSPPGRPQSAGTFVVDTADELGAIGWRVIPPLELAALPSAAARYLDAIRELTTDTFTVRDVAAAVSGEEAATKSQIEQARYHTEALVDARS